MTGRDEDGVPTQAKNFIEELPGAEVQALPNNDEHPPRLHVIRDRLDRATVQSLGAWMQKDAEHAGQIDDLAGYVLVAWNKDGRPRRLPETILSTQSPYRPTFSRAIFRPLSVGGSRMACQKISVVRRVSCNLSKIPGNHLKIPESAPTNLSMQELDNGDRRQGDIL